MVELDPDAQPTTIAAHIQALHISGVTGPLNLIVDGQPLFQPMPIVANRPPRETADLLSAFLTENYIAWGNPPSTSKEASFHGYGFGLCNMESNILTTLWQEHGIKGRLVQWPQHTMAEAYIDNSWNAYDAQHGVSFSTLWNRPTGFADLAKGPAYPEAGLDPIGYGSNHMQRLYKEAKPEFKEKRREMKPPLARLRPGQELLIQPRLTGSDFSLPLEPAPGNRLRDSLIPGYLLLVRETSNGSPITLDTGLPILAVSGDIVEAGTAMVDGHPVTLDQLPQHFEPVTFHLPAGKVLQVHYALAAWVGDRLFRPGALLCFEKPQRGASITTRDQSNQAKITLQNLTQAGPSADGSWTFGYTISWQNLSGTSPQQYELYATELSSELAVEAWRYLDQQQWTWHPETMPGSGEERRSLIFQPQAKAANTLRRPEHYRTILIQVTGPAVKAGHNYLKTRIDTNEQ